MLYDFCYPFYKAAHPLIFIEIFMKTLLLIRHAKSSWNNSDLSDFDRTLNDRGKADAPVMAKKLKDKNIAIDAFVCSPAKRARKTAEFFMKEYLQADKEPTFISRLYEASVNDYYQSVEELNDANNSVAVFAHNPGITEFINSLECSPVYNMPTCAVYALKIDTTSWKEFKEAPKEFLFFDYPKNQD